MDKTQTEHQKTYKDRIRKAIDQSEKGTVLREAIKIMDEKDGERNYDNERISRTDFQIRENDKN